MHARHLGNPCAPVSTNALMQCLLFPWGKTNVWEEETRTVHTCPQYSCICMSVNMCWGQVCAFHVYLQWCFWTHVVTSRYQCTEPGRGDVRVPLIATLGHHLQSGVITAERRNLDHLGVRSPKAFPSSEALRLRCPAWREAVLGYQCNS